MTDRTVQFIKSMEVSEVICRDPHSVRYIQPFDMPALMATDGEMLIPFEEMTITESVVPVTEFCINGKRDIYIAYSREVEELLGIPIEIILREKDAAIAAKDRAIISLNRLQAMTAWQHIKEAWNCITGKEAR